jgi:hypothetical protein
LKNAILKILFKRILPVFAGAALGFTYYYYVGCKSGSCPIQSNPFYSTLYGAVIGFILSFPNRKKITKKMKANKISKDISIEELVGILPEAVTFLMENGIRCLRCGEPAWGTLEALAKEKGFTNEDINGFTERLNNLLINKNLSIEF